MTSISHKRHIDCVEQPSYQAPSKRSTCPALFAAAVSALLANFGVLTFCTCTEPPSERRNIHRAKSTLALSAIAVTCASALHACKPFLEAFYVNRAPLLSDESVFQPSRAMITSQKGCKAGCSLERPLRSRLAKLTLDMYRLCKHCCVSRSLPDTCKLVVFNDEANLDECEEGDIVRLPDTVEGVVVKHYYLPLPMLPSGLPVLEVEGTPGMSLSCPNWQSYVLPNVHTLRFAVFGSHVNFAVVTPNVKRVEIKACAQHISCLVPRSATTVELTLPAPVLLEHALDPAISFLEPAILFAKSLPLEETDCYRYVVFDSVKSLGRLVGHRLVRVSASGCYQKMIVVLELRPDAGKINTR